MARSEGTASPAAAKSAAVAREFSAGGVVVRWRKGRWWMAAIQPTGRFTALSTHVDGRRRMVQLPVLALPKGNIDAGETPARAAVREVHEETGLQAFIVRRLGASRYVYKRSWGDGRRVFKVVTYYLLRYRAGRLGHIAPAMRKEVARCQWLPLTEAATALTYEGDRKMVLAAQEYLERHPAR